jgi:hypothetical protein
MMPSTFDVEHETVNLELYSFVQPDHYTRPRRLLPLIQTGEESVSVYCQLLGGDVDDRNTSSRGCMPGTAPGARCLETEGSLWIDMDA